MDAGKDLHVGLCHPKLALDFITGRRWTGHSFVISGSDGSPDSIPDSCVAPPARYLLEMFLRIADTTTGDSARLFLFNPLAVPSKGELLVLLSVLKRIDSEVDCDQSIIVVCDDDNFPLAYLFPRSVIDAPRYLMLLSCADARLDASALGEIYAAETRVSQVSLSISDRSGNGFYGGKYLSAYVAACRHAIDTLATRRASLPDQDRIARCRDRDALPLHAFISHHAGDVLFASIAALGAKPLFDGLVIHRNFAPICRRAGLTMPVLEFDGPVVHRGGYTGDDPEHFMEILPNLPADQLYCYSRTSRDYNITDSHLISHYSFMLRTSDARAVSDHHLQCLGVSPRSTSPPQRSGRDDAVLLHFGAGWPLKGYPRHWQRSLAERLLQRGRSVTLLDTDIEVSGCRNSRFESIEQFERLLDEHRVLVGMDSFPAHFASLVRGFPTLCLFASTHPVHSRSMCSSRYQWLTRQLDCAPCRAYDTCPRFGGDICHNFLPPEEVDRWVERIEASSTSSVDAAFRANIAPAALGWSVSEFQHRPSSHRPHRLRHDFQPPMLLDPQLLDYRALHRRYRITRIWQGVLRAAGLITEYRLAVRDHGVRHANLLTQAFLKRLGDRLRSILRAESRRHRP